jgi:hypothetical protein
MRKMLLNTLFLASLILNLIPFRLAATETDALPGFISSYVDTLLKTVAYKEIPDYIDKPCPKYITANQAREDIEMFKYLIKTAYSGKAYWEKQGVDFSKCFRELKDLVKNSKTDSISVSQFEDIMYNHLKFINDGHSRIIGFKNRELKKRIMPYFTDLVIEKRNNKYFVLQSELSDIMVGDEYIDSTKYLYKTLSKKDSEQYLIGLLEYDNPKFLKIRFKSGIYDLPLHQCRIGQVINTPNTPAFQVDNIENIPILKIWKFSGRKHIEQIEEFVEYGKKLRNEDFFILNLIGNTGGYSEWGSEFITNLNDAVIDKSYVLWLHSPAISQSMGPLKNYWMLKDMPKSWYTKDGFVTDSCPPRTKAFFDKMNAERIVQKENPLRYWEIENRNIKHDKKGTYKGRTIIISNHYNASAGETTLARIKSSIPNSVIIGENSCGAFVFSSKISYCLKNSLIKLQLTKSLEIHPDCHGDKGFLPDYWLDSKEPVKEIVDWINNPETYQFIY